MNFKQKKYIDCIIRLYREKQLSNAAGASLKIKPDDEVGQKHKPHDTNAPMVHLISSIIALTLIA